jgi:hypothetical protein
MDYTNILGDIVKYPININVPEFDRVVNKTREYDYDRPRLGITDEMIDHQEHYIDIEKILHRTQIKGYKNGIPKDINPVLMRHVQQFRNYLDVYDIVAKHKVFSVDEIWDSCLRYGSDYSKFIKKSRQFSLQNKISVTEDALNEEYIHEEYSGYDSIIHERYLIYWDDREETVDWLYSLLEPSEDHSDEFAKMAKRFIMHNKLDSLLSSETDTVQLFEPIAGKMSSLNTLDGKTTQLKNAWNRQCGPGHWLGTRKVVATSCHQTRDTCVPDIFSLYKLKVIHKIARAIGEHVPYIANCSSDKLNKRLERIRNGRNFIHLDFKKFGLTFDRKNVNVLLKLLDREYLCIDQFNLVVDGETIKTNRGGVLGWFDPIVAIVISIILHDLKEKCEMNDLDFIIFNDDVEISTGERTPEGLEVLKRMITSRLEYFGFIISHRKTYASRMSIFLEQYTYPGRLDMSKNQLIVKQFGGALTTPFTWEAKVLFADGWKHYKHSLLRELVLNSIVDPLNVDFNKPVELGGWIHHMSGNLNLALVDADPGELQFFFKMGRWKRPKIPGKFEYVDVSTLAKRADRLVMDAIKADGREIGCVPLDPQVTYSPQRAAAMVLIAGDKYAKALDMFRIALYDDSATEGIPDG